MHNAVWVSDIHLGSIASQQESLLNFLNNIETKILYLNGDVFDKLIIKNPTKYVSIIKKIHSSLKKISERGSEIIFLEGNHDPIPELKMLINGFKLKKECLHITRKDDRLLVFHGHSLDKSVDLKHVWIVRAGRWLYEHLHKREACCRKKKKTKLSRQLKIKSKNAFRSIFNYEQKLHDYATKHNYTGIVCGHSHQPCIKNIQSIRYYNSGDWIETCTYLYETEAGDIKLGTWNMP